MQSSGICNVGLGLLVMIVVIVALKDKYSFWYELLRRSCERVPKYFIFMTLTPTRKSHEYFTNNFFEETHASILYEVDHVSFEAFECLRRKINFKNFDHLMTSFFLPLPYLSPLKKKAPRYHIVV